jgi:hypothetical protein
MTKICYCVPFSCVGVGGKARATRQKIRALSALGFDVIHLQANSGRLLIRLANMIIIEFRLVQLALSKKCSIFICRGPIGFFLSLISQFIAITVIREKHADQAEEAKYLTNIRVKIWFFVFLEFLDRYLMRTAHHVLFNNKLLEDNYSKITHIRHPLIFYNGFEAASVKKLVFGSERKMIRQKFGISNAKKVLVFTGSCSAWHGIELIIGMAKLLKNSNILIVVAGGHISIPDDLCGVLLNFSPADENVCSELISVSDAAIVPINSNRSSPGNALKMYDYFGAQIPVFVQRGLSGYHDEFEKYGLGGAVNFFEPVQACKDIEIFFKNSKLAEVNSSQFEWTNRYRELMNVLNIEIHI